MEFQKLRNSLSEAFSNLMKRLTGVIPKRKDLILFSAWFGRKYADNSRYLFEYMLYNSKYIVFWYTKDKNLYKEMLGNNIPVVYSKSLKGIWYQCRAIMLVSTVQTSDFNKLFLNNCIYLDLGHGFPGKPVGLLQPTAKNGWADWFYYTRRGLNYYETASSYFTVEYLRPCYDVQPDHFIFSNKPRIDVLFNKSLQEGLNKNVDVIKAGKRLITYMPTHRSCGQKEMNIFEIFDLRAIQDFCEQTDSVFLIKKHFYHNKEITNLAEYSCIFDLTNEDVDTEVLLAQTDVLITDFSSCFIDFLALERPILFYAYDYDNYMKNEREYYWKYDMIRGGYTTKNKTELLTALINLSNDWMDTKHIVGRKEMRRLYFDDEVEMGSSRERLNEIIDQLIKGTYVPFDWNRKKH